MVGFAEGGEESANFGERELAALLAGLGMELGRHGAELVDGRRVRHGRNSIEGDGPGKRVCLALRC